MLNLMTSTLRLTEKKSHMEKDRERNALFSTTKKKNETLL